MRHTEVVSNALILTINKQSNVESSPWGNFEESKLRLDFKGVSLELV
jgi:hypothetical protein